jgi:hypothetical protein
VTMVLHVGVSRPTACRSSRDVAHAIAISRSMACRSGRDAGHTVAVSRPTACWSGRDAACAGREPLPYPSATDKWGRDQIQTVPCRCCPLDHTAHMVWPANKCFFQFSKLRQVCKIQNALFWCSKIFMSVD